MDYDESSGGRRQGVSDGGESAIGPLIGLRRPNYEVLDSTLGPFLNSKDENNNDFFLFVNLGAALRHLFSEYAVAKLTKSEMNRHPRVLAAELVNLAGHYRHYAWKRFGRRTTVLLYHSTRKCDDKMEVFAGYKAGYYSKRIDPPSAEYEVLRKYVDFNLATAAALFRHIPNAHLVDTGPMDPEAWPWAVMSEGRIPGPAVVISSWHSDLQYTLAPGHPGRAVLLAKGPYTVLLEAPRLMEHVLRDSKTGPELAALLSPNHFPYVLGMAGDADIGAPGIRKFGPARAAKLISQRVADGRLPADCPSLTALCEDGVTADQIPEVGRAWKLLIHQDYVARHVTDSMMAAVDGQMLNRSGLGQLEAANAKLLDKNPMNLDMIFAGEEY